MPDASDELFKRATKGTQALHREAKRLIRIKKRKEWWAQNGNPPPHDRKKHG